MAFRTQLTASRAFGRIYDQIIATKAYLATQRALMVQAACLATVPLQVIQHLGTVDSRLSVWATTPGLATYARSEFDDPAYDVVAEFNAIKGAITNAKNALIGMFPKDGNGFILYQTIQPDGSLQLRTFTAAQLAGAVAQIDAVLAAID